MAGEVPQPNKTLKYHVQAERLLSDRMSLLGRDVSHLTEMIEELATTDPESIASPSSPLAYRSAIQGTPRASRFVSDGLYVTPHKEADDPNWPTREVSYASTPSYGDRAGPPRYPGGTSPRKSAARIVSGKIDDHIYTRGYLEGACSDITISAFGKPYMMHRIILDRSPFFSMMFSGPWKDSDSKSMELKFDDKNITCAAFEFALARIYGRFNTLDGMDCLSLLATAAYLDLEELQEQCTNWQLRVLNSATIAKVVKFVHGPSTYGISSERLREACRALLLRDGFEMTPAEWEGIPIDLVAEIVADDAFFCPSELDRYHFIAKLLRSRQDCPDDVNTLEQVLLHDVHYMHMSWTELNEIEEEGLLDRTILRDAWWNQTKLKEQIESKQEPILGITSDVETEYPVPADDTCYIGDPLLTPPSTTMPAGTTMYSMYPPFRFSAEFDRVNDLKEDTRVYSHTVFYAGSYWNIYIHNKVRARKSRQLGVYLHRVEIKGQSTSAHPELSSSPTHNGLSSSPPIKDAQGNPLATVLDAKRSYVDPRSTISTYFKIYCPSRKNTSKIGVTEFRSGPDEFHKSQSWGWKSRGLCAYDERESVESIDGGEIGGLKFMVVLGVV